MADAKDGKGFPSTPMRANRRRPEDDDATSRPLRDEISADPLIEALQHLGDDIIREPVPDRLLEALREKLPSSKNSTSDS